MTEPGERRLPHPPSDRYRDLETEASDAARAQAAATSAATSPAKGVAYGLAAATVGAAAIIVLGGVLALSAGLLVVAAITGWAVAIGLRAGAGPHFNRGARIRLALVFATLALGVGQLGLWLYARSEGGVLGPFDYLAETFGFLVPSQFVAAWFAAFATARAR